MKNFFAKIKSQVQKYGLMRFVKFGIVGGSGVVVNMFFLWLFTDIFRIYYLISSAVAIFLAMTNNFIWNDLWTWKGRGGGGFKAYLFRFLKFCFISGMADYVGNLSILWILTHFFHVYYLISNLVAIATVMLFKFFLHDHWTFRQNSEI
ncbi:MAG: GtrA family protein [Calditrichaeota bacterium]|nr:GtrA family protein [Calditrichota bacterium]